MKQSFKLAFLTAASLICTDAFAQGAVRIFSPVLDTEAAKGWNFSPSAEFSFATPVRSAWSARTQLRMPQQKIGDPQAQLSLRVKEAAASLEFEEGTFTAGRLLVRPESNGINELSKTFLRSEPSVDGMRFETTLSDSRVSAFAGGPWVLGFALAHNFGKTKFSLLYRGERDKISNYLLVSPEGDIVNSPRAAHTQEAEVAVKTAGETFEVEGLFQLMNQGLQRTVTRIDDTWGEVKIGAVDAALPRSFNDYRVAAQAKFLLDSEAANKDWLMLSWASRTAPRLHDGTEDERFFRQGGGNDSQFAAAIEAENPLFTAQLGTGLEYSATPKYLLLSRRGDDGKHKFVRFKNQFWVSTRIKF
ncbi:MAG: hypothetical protein RI932_1070 [Pseudomonadota bacterium]|jgi:hypothetical protein